MLKKGIAFLFGFCFVFTTHLASASSDSYETTQATSLHASASTKAKTLQRLNNKTKVTLIKHSGQWSYVSHGKQKGFVMSSAIVPAKIPIKSFSQNEVMTYKGTEVVSITGKSYKIDPALLPFFRQNAATLKSTLVIPKTNGRTLIGWHRLQIGFFVPVRKTFQIDRVAASRIDSLSVHHGHTTVTTAGPLRQIVVDTMTDSVPDAFFQTTLTLNGSVRQLHSNGLFTLRGKGTITRWDVDDATTYSYALPVSFAGDVDYLNMQAVDGVIRASKTFRVHAAALPQASSLLDGPNGYLGDISVSKLIRGKRMDSNEQSIAKTLTQPSSSRVKQLFDQLKLTYSAHRIDAYTTALRENEAAGANKRLVQTKTDVQFIVSTVDRVLSTQTTSPVFVDASAREVKVKTVHRLQPDTSWTAAYSRNVTATVQDGTLQHITFKRGVVASSQLAEGLEDGKAFTSQTPGTYRIVHLDDERLTSYTYTVGLTAQGHSVLETINERPLADYQTAPPRYDAKQVNQGHRSYLVIRSNDRAWLKQVHRYDLPVHANYIAGGSAVSNNVRVPGWDPDDTIVMTFQNGRLNDGLVVHAYGYTAAPYK